MAGGIYSENCCGFYRFMEMSCPVHGPFSERMKAKRQSNEQNVKPEENKASYRQHSFVEYAEIPEVTYTHRPLVG